MTKRAFIASLLASIASTFSTWSMAELSRAQTIGVLSGRIIGAAKACGVDGNWLASVGEKAFAAIESRGISERDKGTAIMLVAEGMNIGSSQVSSGKVKCPEARRAVDDLDRQFSTRK